MKDIQAIDELAAQWHAREMLGRLTPDDALRLDAWLAEDVRHRLAYADVAAAGYALQQTAAPPAARAAPRAVRRWPVWAAAALAPAVLLAALLLAPRAWQDWHSDAHTAIGAVHSHQLADGSLLQLDTDSAVALPFAADHRDVELLRGALSVQVAKDAEHPFRVHCAGIEARAVGTRFVVARHTDEVEVGVTEGTVAVRASEHAEAVLVQAGQRARVDTRSGELHSDALPGTSDGWTRGVLSFDRAPLQQVVDEIARYVPEHVLLRVDARAAATPVTATFPIEHPEAALRALAATHGLTLRHVPKLLYVIQD